MLQIWITFPRNIFSYYVRGKVTIEKLRYYSVQKISYGTCKFKKVIHSSSSSLHGLDKTLFPTSFVLFNLFLGQPTSLCLVCMY